MKEKKREETHRNMKTLEKQKANNGWDGGPGGHGVDLGITLLKWLNERWLDWHGTLGTALYGKEEEKWMQTDKKGNGKKNEEKKSNERRKKREREKKKRNGRRKKKSDNDL